MSRRFELHRDVDVNGVSGLGCVAEGVMFSDGFCVTHWLSKDSSTAVWHHRGADSIYRIHGHDGLTRIVWLDA